MFTKKLPSVAIVCAIFGLDLAYADQVVQKPEFSISLPDGWVEIPRNVLDEYARGLAAAAPNAPSQHYNYGFQSPGKDWFEYPYILSQVLNTGRIPDNELSQIENIPIDKEIDKQRAAFEPAMSDLQVGKPGYDRAENIIWLSIEMNVTGVGTVAGISGMVPTQNGLLTVNGYAPKAEFATHEPAFRLAIKSLKPSADLVYKPGTGSTASRRGFQIGRIVGFAIVGGIVAAIFAAIRRRADGS